MEVQPTMVKGGTKETTQASLIRIPAGHSSHSTRTRSIIKAEEELSTVTISLLTSSTINLNLLTTPMDPMGMTRPYKRTITHSKTTTTASIITYSTNRAVAMASGDRPSQLDRIPTLLGCPNLRALSKCQESFPTSYLTIRISNSLTAPSKFRNSRVRTRPALMLKHLHPMAVKTSLSHRPWLASASPSISTRSALVPALKHSSSQATVLHFSIKVAPIRIQSRTASRLNQTPVMHMGSIISTASTIPATQCNCS